MAKSKMFDKLDQDIPATQKNKKELTIHGDTRIDNYYWLNERGNENVIRYLESENAYRENVMSHLEGLQDELFEEIKGRIKKDDASVPFKRNGYYYYTRYEKGKEYPFFCRKKDNLNSEEDIMLNVNNLADGHSYYQVGGRSIDEANKTLAFGVDTQSRRIYTIHFKDLESGELLEEKIPNTTGYAVWANDNQTVFYAQKDETLRSYKIFRHRMGTPSEDDVEVYHEEDQTFSCYVSKSKSKKFIVISCHQTLSNEYRYISADNPESEFSVFLPRERKHEYSIQHFKDHWFITTNWLAENFRLMKTDLDKTSKENWEEVIPHRKDVLLNGLTTFNDYMVLEERIEGINRIRIRSGEGEDHRVDFGEDAYTAYASVNPEADTDILRLQYSSMTTPSSTLDYNMKTKEVKILKEQEVLGGFNKADYKSERLMIEGRDGVKIPVSLVHHKSFKKDGSSPVLLYAYGSYGASMDPYFSSVRLSLLNRGFAFAIAHIRGGQEMGRQWYENGKLLNKKNTFNDFIDCGEHLVNNHYCGKDQLYAMGGSAGGLLMGAVMNMRPELWNGVIAAVPFVDVITTMLDESIPLTTGEYDEWGNPNEEKYYKYIKSYSPYDNVEAKEYPSLLVTTGYHDSQVQYWEPAKWVALLREKKTNNNPLVMYCNMDTGHGGASGRFERFKETAMEYAFLLDLAGLTH